MECVNGEMRPANARVVQEDGVTYYEFRHKNGRWERRFSMRESKRVGEAGPAGMGLFAERDYGSTEVLCVYGGVDLGIKGTKEAEDALKALLKAKKGRHTMEIRSMEDQEKHYVDGLDDARGAYLVNSAYNNTYNTRKQAWETNYDEEKATFKKTGTITVKKGAYIYKGDEILMCYGADYWKLFNPKPRQNKKRSRDTPSPPPLPHPHRRKASTAGDTSRSKRKAAAVAWTPTARARMMRAVPDGRPDRSEDAVT